jgi:hypothetical protein
MSSTNHSLLSHTIIVLQIHYRSILFWLLDCWPYFNSTYVIKPIVHFSTHSNFYLLSSYEMNIFALISLIPILSSFLNLLLFALSPYGYFPDFSILHKYLDSRYYKIYTELLLCSLRCFWVFSFWDVAIYLEIIWPFRGLLLSFTRLDEASLYCRTHLVLLLSVYYFPQVLCITNVFYSAGNMNYSQSYGITYSFPVIFFHVSLPCIN